MVRNLKATGKAHLRIGGFHELLHRTACVQRLAVCVRKQFNRRNIGVGIGDPSCHQAALIGLRFPHTTDLWNKKSKYNGIQRDPKDKGQEQQHIERADHTDHGDKINHHKHHDVANAQQDVPDGEGRLHDFGRNPSGKLVLIKTHALRKHQAMEVPAQSHREVTEQGLILE